MNYVPLTILMLTFNPSYTKGGEVDDDPRTFFVDNFFAQKSKNYLLFLGD